MERKPYSAGAVKFSFWFMEFRKTVQLLSEGKSFADIKKLNEETNIYGAPTKLRASVIDLSLAAPSLSAAKAMCRQWPKKYEEIYAKIMEGLL